MKSTTGITKIFNVMLFLYLLFVSLTGYLFESDNQKKVPWDDVYALSPFFAIITAFFLSLLLIFVGAVVVRIFWNRFIADVFKVREITYDESLRKNLGDVVTYVALT